MSPGGRHAGALVSVSLHALAAAALLAHEPARTTLLAAAPLMVELIAPTPRPPAPSVVTRETPPAPRPVPHALPRPPEPRPVVAAAAATPATFDAVPPPPAVPMAPPAAPPAPLAAAPAPAPITPPVANAAFLNNPPPDYPPLSQRLGEQGRVHLRVLVGAGGTAEEIQVLRSSGHARLDRAATDAVKRWKFVPAMQGARPVAMWTTMDLLFAQKD